MALQLFQLVDEIINLEAFAPRHSPFRLIPRVPTRPAGHGLRRSGMLPPGRLRELCSLRSTSAFFPVWLHRWAAAAAAQARRQASDRPLPRNAIQASRARTDPLVLTRATVNLKLISLFMLDISEREPYSELYLTEQPKCDIVARPRVIVKTLVSNSSSPRPVPAFPLGRRARESLKCLAQTRYTHAQMD